jgi:ankyrin repeat protein
MGSTPLMLASVFGRDNNVKLLLEKGADVSLRDNKGLSATDHALKHDSGAVLPLLEAAHGKRG